MRKEDIKLNCIVSDISLKGNLLYRFEIIPQTDKDIDLIIYGNRVAKEIQKQGITAIHTGYNYIYFFDQNEIPSTVYVDGIPFDLRNVQIETLNPEAESHNRVVKNIISTQVRKILQKMGYILEDNGTLYKPEFTESENIEAHPAVEIQIHSSPLGRVLIFLDVKRRWVCPLTKFIQSLGETSHEKITEILKGKEVMVHRTYRHLKPMKIVDILDVKHKTHRLGVEGQPSIYEYWSEPTPDLRTRIEKIKEKLGYTPQPEDTGVAILTGKSARFDYPVQVLRMKIDLSDLELLELLDLDVEKTYLSPKEREKEIDQIFSQLVKQTYDFHDRKLSFGINSIPRWGTINELEKDGFEIIEITPPELEFGSGIKIPFETGTTKINRALRNGGPYSGKRNIVLDLACPNNTPIYMIDNFFTNVIKLYNDYNLGEIKRGQVIYTPEDPIPYGAEVARFYFSEKDAGHDISNRFVIGVLPYDREDACHHALNNELLQVGIPSKCIRLMNFKGIKPTRPIPHLYPIVGAIYERSLKTADATWILAEKAGKSTPQLEVIVSEGQKKKEGREYTTIYIGFDVSRVRGKAEVASYATICEPHGRVINVRDMNFKGEYLSDTEVRDIINNVLREYDAKRRELELGIVDEIVFFKDGDTRGPIAMNAIENGLEMVKKDLINSGRASENLKISYITAKKRIIHRIFGDEKHLPEGICVVNKKYKNPQAIIVTTTPLSQRTTQSPNMLTLMMQIGEDDSTSIYRIAKEYHDLRFLHWETWRIQPGNALPLHIVQHKAKQLGYGYNTVYIPK